VRVVWQTVREWPEFLPTEARRKFICQARIDRDVIGAARPEFMFRRALRQFDVARLSYRRRDCLSVCHTLVLTQN